MPPKTHNRIWQEEVIACLSKLNTQVERLITDQETTGTNVIRLADEQRVFTNAAESRLTSQMDVHESHDNERFEAMDTKLDRVTARVNVGLGIAIALNAIGAAAVTLYELLRGS